MKKSRFSDHKSFYFWETFEGPSLTRNGYMENSLLNKIWTCMYVNCVSHFLTRWHRTCVWVVKKELGSVVKPKWLGLERPPMVLHYFSYLVGLSKELREFNQQKQPLTFHTLSSTTLPLSDNEGARCYSPKSALCRRLSLRFRRFWSRFLEFLFV